MKRSLSQLRRAVLVCHPDARRILFKSFIHAVVWIHDYLRGYIYPGYAELTYICFCHLEQSSSLATIHHEASSKTSARSQPAETANGNLQESKPYDNEVMRDDNDHSGPRKITNAVPKPNFDGRKAGVHFEAWSPWF